MIPENRLSSKPVISAYTDSFYLGSLLKAVEWGGVALNDPSQGLLVKPWTVEYKFQSGNVVVSAADVPETVLFTRPDVSEVSLAFDRNMQPVVAFVQDGQAKLYFYDSLLPGYRFLETELGDAKNPRVTHDDKRNTQSASADVILAYVVGDSLRYRQQRDRYLIERTLMNAGVIRLVHVGMNAKMRLQFMYVGIGEAPPSLADIVSGICLRANIPPMNIDVNELYDISVVGYKINTKDSANARIDALRKIFFFDKSEHDSKLYFPRRGREVTAQIPYVHLVADDPAALAVTLIQEKELPAEVNVTHLDPAGGFANNKQTVRRKSNLVTTTKKIDIESEVVLTADQAATTALVTSVTAWGEPQKYKFKTHLQYAEVVVTDTVEVQDKKGNWHIVRITERNEDRNVITFEGVADAQELYASLGVGNALPPPVSTTPGLIGPTRLEILNIPCLREQDDELGVYLAVCGESSGWYGSSLLVSTDGINFAEAMTIETPATIGDLLTDLAAENVLYPADQSFEVLVNYPLESITKESLFQNINRCVIGDEVAQFQNAIFLGMEDGKYRYRCSGLIRGRYATVVESWPVGTRFVLIDTSIAFLQAQQFMLGREISFKPVSSGQTEDETVQTDYDYDVGMSQLEFPVYNVKASRAGSTLTVSFTGRGRLGIDTDPKNGKYFVGYRVKYSNGQSFDVQTQSHVYANAPTGITVQVCAVNSITGEGPLSAAIPT